MNDEGVRSYALSALGFITGLTVSDFSTTLQISSFLISCIAGVFSIWLHQKQIREIKRHKEEDHKETTNEKKE